MRPAHSGRPSIAPRSAPTRKAGDRKGTGTSAIDLIAASVDASLEIVEHAIFGEDLVDGRASPRGVVLTEDVLKIAGQ